MTSFGRFFFISEPISVDVGTGSCHAARSTLVMLEATQMACKTSGFKSYSNTCWTHLTCSTAATESQGAHACYSSDVCVIPQQYIPRHILSMSTRYIAVDAAPGGCTKY